jgi:DNA-binding transcriptional MerR regulator/methylmalonyl-CoA mutase cobalamin-binding subunit
MTAEERGADQPRYRIGAVTRLTGLSADVVRVWERRYGAIRPARTEGGSRLYSDAEISRLRRLRQATEKGHSIGQVAQLSETELEQLIGGLRQTADAPDPYAALCERFLEAIARLDVVTADLELTRAATLFPARPLIKKVVAPILDEVGERWAHKEFGIAHEHVATGLLRNLLSALFRLYPPKDFAETIVLATPAGERHEFGLLLAALLAATRGWRVVYLGSDLPAEEIARTMRLTNARYLGLSIVASENTETREELSELARLLPPETRVWVGGEDARRHRDLIEGADWILVPDLDDLDDRLNR